MKEPEEPPKEQRYYLKIDIEKEEEKEIKPKPDKKPEEVKPKQETKAEDTNLYVARSIANFPTPVQREMAPQPQPIPDPVPEPRVQTPAPEPEPEPVREPIPEQPVAPAPAPVVFKAPTPPWAPAKAPTPPPVKEEPIPPWRDQPATEKLQEPTEEPAPKPKEVPKPVVFQNRKLVVGMVNKIETQNIEEEKNDISQQIEQRREETRKRLAELEKPVLVVEQEEIPEPEPEYEDLEETPKELEEDELDDVPQPEEEELEPEDKEEEEVEEEIKEAETLMEKKVTFSEQEDEIIEENDDEEEEEKPPVIFAAKKEKSKAFSEAHSNLESFFKTNGKRLSPDTSPDSSPKFSPVPLRRPSAPKIDIQARTKHLHSILFAAEPAKPPLLRTNRIWTRPGSYLQPDVSGLEPPSPPPPPPPSGPPPAVALFNEKQVIIEPMTPEDEERTEPPPAPPLPGMEEAQADIPDIPPPPPPPPPPLPFQALTLEPTPETSTTAVITAYANVEADAMENAPVPEEPEIIPGVDVDKISEIFEKSPEEEETVEVTSNKSYHNLIMPKVFSAKKERVTFKPIVPSPPKERRKLYSPPPPPREPSPEVFLEEKAEPEVPLPPPEGVAVALPEVEESHSVDVEEPTEAPVSKFNQDVDDVIAASDADLTALEEKEMEKYFTEETPVAVEGPSEETKELEEEPELKPESLKVSNKENVMKALKEKPSDEAFKPQRLVQNRIQALFTPSTEETPVETEEPKSILDRVEDFEKRQEELIDEEEKAMEEEVKKLEDKTRPERALLPWQRPLPLFGSVWRKEEDKTETGETKTPEEAMEATPPKDEPERVMNVDTEDSKPQEELIIPVETAELGKLESTIPPAYRHLITRAPEVEERPVEVETPEDIIVPEAVMEKEEPAEEAMMDVEEEKTQEEPKVQEVEMLPEVPLEPEVKVEMKDPEEKEEADVEEVKSVTEKSLKYEVIEPTPEDAIEEKPAEETKVYQSENIKYQVIDKPDEETTSVPVQPAPITKPVMFPIYRPKKPAPHKVEINLDEADASPIQPVTPPRVKEKKPETEVKKKVQKSRPLTKHVATVAINEDNVEARSVSKINIDDFKATAPDVAKKVLEETKEETRGKIQKSVVSTEEDVKAPEKKQKASSTSTSTETTEDVSPAARKFLKETTQPKAQLEETVAEEKPNESKKKHIVSIALDDDVETTIKAPEPEAKLFQETPAKKHPAPETAEENKATPQSTAPPFRHITTVPLGNDAPNNIENDPPNKPKENTTATKQAQPTETSAANKELNNRMVNGINDSLPAIDTNSNEVPAFTNAPEPRDFFTRGSTVIQLDDDTDAILDSQALANGNASFLKQAAPTPPPKPTVAPRKPSFPMEAITEEEPVQNDSVSAPDGCRSM